MAERFEHSEDDEMTEILRRAVRKEGGSGDLRARLHAAADELGISHAAVAEAEAEYRMEAGRKRQLAIYNKERRRGIKNHLITYAAVNLGMIGVNAMTFPEDHEIWFPYILLLWGIALGIHAFIAVQKADWDDEEFQKWRAERVAKAQEIQ
jgi:hypothetical protein